MARLVEIVGLSHDPTLPAFMQAGDPRLKEAQGKYEELRERLRQSRPDALVVVSNDHLSQFFMDNMPPFAVGKAPVVAGPFKFEQEMFRLDRYETSGDIGLAKVLIERGFDHGVDFAFSDEFTLDHGFTVPLGCVRPERDLPVVPIFVNVMAPPMPPAARCYRVGETIRRIIEEMPGGKRVAVVSTAHLSFDVGGPRMPGAIDQDWDRMVIGLIREGNVAKLIEESAFEKLVSVGNVAPGFLNFVMVVGIAGGQAASMADVLLYDDMISHPFLAWDLHRSRK